MVGRRTRRALDRIDAFVQQAIPLVPVRIAMGVPPCLLAPTVNDSECLAQTFGALAQPFDRQAMRRE